MLEKEPYSITIRPEDILTAREAEVQQWADWGGLPCPWCGEALMAEKVVCDVYQGVVLTCLIGCGWREL